MWVWIPLVKHPGLCHARNYPPHHNHQDHMGTERKTSSLTSNVCTAHTCPFTHCTHPLPARPCPPSTTTRRLSQQHPAVHLTASFSVSHWPLPPQGGRISRLEVPGTPFSRQLCPYLTGHPRQAADPGPGGGEEAEGVWVWWDQSPSLPFPDQPRQPRSLQQSPAPPSLLPWYPGGRLT